MPYVVTTENYADDYKDRNVYTDTKIVETELDAKAAVVSFYWECYEERLEEEICDGEGETFWDAFNGKDITTPESRILALYDWFLANESKFFKGEYVEQSYNAYYEKKDAEPSLQVKEADSALSNFLTRITENVGPDSYFQIEPVERGKTQILLVQSKIVSTYDDSDENAEGERYEDIPLSEYNEALKITDYRPGK
tara:strand:- start:754 stop:1341 length:588 start_codon:yes stop_codon:yes gene_type:complete